jgi:hypothetical protein
MAFQVKKKKNRQETEAMGMEWRKIGIIILVSFFQNLMVGSVNESFIVIMYTFVFLKISNVSGMC